MVFTLQDIEKVDAHLKKSEIILNKLFKTTKEPKLLKESIINLYLAHKLLVQNMLTPNEQKKSIEDQLVRLHLLTGVDQKYLQVIKDVYLLKKYEEESATEFTRRDALILCDNNFKTNIITQEDVELCLYQTKKIIPLLYRGIKND
jgi:hypothetical protein